MAYNYTNPGWNNLNPPALNATNLNNISTLLAALGAAFDNGGDPSYLLGNSGFSSWQTAVANLGQRGIVSTSGAVGTLTVTCDTDYILTAAAACASYTTAAYRGDVKIRRPIIRSRSFLLIRTSSWHLKLRHSFALR